MRVEPYVYDIGSKETNRDVLDAMMNTIADFRETIADFRETTDLHWKTEAAVSFFFKGSSNQNIFNS